ncbi:MAG TPA: DUF1059 domain-containing protein [Dehalococcoidia bacterium]|nr:DUF1059 domain-containing protein [Dehalococcoidia bacterium]
MARAFSCSETGNTCDFVARGETDDEVLQRVGEHADRVHGLKDVPPELISHIRSKIRDE